MKVADANTASAAIDGAEAALKLLEDIRLDRPKVEEARVALRALIFDLMAEQNKENS